MTKTNRSLDKQLDDVDTMPVADLRNLFAQVTGRATTSRNTTYLRTHVKRGLAERAAAIASARAKQPRKKPAGRAPKADTAGRKVRTDPRLPAAGTRLEREYRGKRYEVDVVEGGFLFDGERFTSLSMIAKRITNMAWNGFTFFKLQPAQKAGAAA